MSDDLSLPDLIRFEDYGGEWAGYEEALWGRFRQDFLIRSPRLDGLPVWIDRRLAANGKEKSFWHLTDAGGDVDGERVPDLRRCERIAWVRYVIEHVTSRRVLSSEEKTSKGTRRRLTLDDYSYLVVLQRARTHFLLITAFYLEHEHTRRKLSRQHRWAAGTG